MAAVVEAKSSLSDPSCFELPTTMCQLKLGVVKTRFQKAETEWISLINRIRGRALFCEGNLHMSKQDMRFLIIFFKNLVVVAFG